MKLFLDDNRQPYDVFKNTIDPIYENNNEWSIVKNYEEFVNAILESGLPEIISFDHDLSQNHYLPENQTNIDYKTIKDRTGFDAALWLVGYCRMNNLELPIVKVHSANPEGKKNIERVLHLTNKST
jgi:hypothetical protein